MKKSVFLLCFLYASAVYTAPKSPEIIHAGLVSPNILALTVKEKEIIKTGQTVYTQLPGDKIDKGEKLHSYPPGWGTAGN